MTDKKYAVKKTLKYLLITISVALPRDGSKLCVRYAVFSGHKENVSLKKEKKCGRCSLVFKLAVQML